MGAGYRRIRGTVMQRTRTTLGTMQRADAQSLLDDALGEYAVPGAQLGLLRGDERMVVCAGIRGLQDDRPVVPETAFHAGSLAKAVTGLVILDAARRGDLDLDLPCSEHDEGLWSETPRVLLSQTSGRPNLLPEPDEWLEDFVARTVDLPLVHEPGRFSYCNAGWSVLDLLLQRTTGLAFEQAACEALGTGTTFRMPAGGSRGHAAVPGQGPTPVPSTYGAAASAAGSQWWGTADHLLDFADLNLRGGNGVFHEEDVLAVRTPAASLPGATVFDAWGLGWATWDRGDHHAFGWAGYTDGHRSFLRGFPPQGAALVLLTNSAGSLFGPPGGSALIDALLPRLLEILEVPALPEPEYADASTPATELVGQYGPLVVEADGPDVIRLHAQAFGLPEPANYERLGGDTFNVRGNPPGSTPVAFDDSLLYLGPFAMPRH
jgi:CubicO group peptidase (beta-lactamase class C family)